MEVQGSCILIVVPRCKDGGCCGIIHGVVLVLVLVLGPGLVLTLALALGMCKGVVRGRAEEKGTGLLVWLTFCS